MMSNTTLKNSIGNFIESGDPDSLDLLKKNVHDIFTSAGKKPIDMNEIFSYFIDYFKESSDEQKKARIISILHIFMEQHSGLVISIEKEYVERITRLQNYVTEMERTSKLMGRQNLVLSYFYQAGQMLSFSLDYDHIISTIVEMITNIFDDCFCCMLTLEKNGLLKATSHGGMEVLDFASYFNERISMETGEGCEGQAVNEQMPCQIFDVYTAPQYRKFIPLADVFGFKSVLSVPLSIRGKSEGCISIYSRDRRFFQEEEVRILSMFSDQAVRAIENARLYQETDKDLQFKIKELQLMHDIDQAVINNDKLAVVAGRLLEGMEKLLPEFGLALDLTRIDPAIFLANETFKMMGIAGIILKSFAHDFKDASSFLQKEVFINSKFVQFYGFPVFVQEECVGALWMGIDNIENISPDLIEFIRWILTQVSIAIDKNKTIEQLIHAEKMNMLGSLLSGIAHELNSPLARILGLSEAAKEEKDTDEAKKYFDTIKEETLRCKRIMEDFLAFSRKYKAKETPADINKLIEETLNLWNYQKKTDDMKISTNLDKNLPAMLINTNRIQQVFLNLIVNAYDALSESSEKALKITTSSEKGKVRITFHDSGPGIELIDKDKIFQPFYTTKEQGKGTGLGLSLSKDIIKEHKGNIWADSPPEGGGMFIIELPASKEVAIKTNETQLISKPASVKGSTVLIADDDPLVLKLVSSFLNKQGFKVSTAVNGSECLGKIKADSSYDVIITDMIMPDIRGDKLIEILSGEMPELLKKIILCTGDLIEVDKLSDFEEKGVNVIYKPFELIELKNVVESKLSQLIK